jgi:hypothetical protein
VWLPEIPSLSAIAFLKYLEGVATCSVDVAPGAPFAAPGVVKVPVVVEDSHSPLHERADIAVSSPPVTNKGTHL